MQNDKSGEGTLIENWAKLQDSLSKCRGIKANPIRQMFLNSPEIPGATTSIQNEYSYKGMLELVEQFEKLKRDLPVVGKAEEVNSAEDQWDGAVLQQMFGEEVQDSGFDRPGFNGGNGWHRSRKAAEAKDRGF